MRSEKMFKSRIKKWKLDKNNRLDEVKIIVRIHAQRRGKPTRMFLRGRPVPINKVKFYLKRKGISVQDVLNSTAKVPPDLDLVCETPSETSPVLSPSTMESMTPTSFGTLEEEESSPRIQEGQRLTSIEVSRRPETLGPLETAGVTIPRRIESPNPLKAAEYLFAKIPDYIDGCFETRFWYSTSPDEECGSLGHVEGEVDDVVDNMSSVIGSACSLFDDGCKDEGNKQISDGLGCIGSLIKAQRTHSLPRLVELMNFLMVKGHRQIAAMLCQAIFQKAAIKDAEKDPLTIMFGQLFLCLGHLIHVNEEGDLLMTAMQRIVEILVRRLGAVHMQTLRTNRSLTEMVKKSQGPVVAEGQLSEHYCLLRKQHSLGRHSLGPIQRAKVLLDLAEMRLDCNRVQDAISTAEKAIVRAEPLRNSSKRLVVVDQLCTGHYLVARAHVRQGNHDQAEQSYRTLLTLGEVELGTYHWVVKHYRTRLWDFLVSQGKLSDAAELVFPGSLDEFSCMVNPASTTVPPPVVLTPPTMSQGSQHSGLEDLEQSDWSTSPITSSTSTNTSPPSSGSSPPHHVDPSKIRSIADVVACPHWEI